MKKIILTLTALAATALAAQAQTNIASWTFEPDPLPTAVTNAAIGPFSPAVGSGIFTGLHATNVTSWTSPVGNGSSDSVSANNWAIGDYFQLQFSTLTFSNIAFSWSQARSSTGPTNFSLAYSVDGSSFTTYTNYTVLQSGGSGAPGTWGSSSNNPIYVLSYDMSSITALDNQSDVYFRLVADSAPSSNTGTSRIDDITITGVPEPSTYAMLALAGAGFAGYVIRRRRR